MSAAHRPIALVPALFFILHPSSFILALILAHAAGCVEYNTECSPPVGEPEKIVFWLEESVPVARAVVRTQESALGNAITDAYLAAIRQWNLQQAEHKPEPQVALDNAGDIRDAGLCVTRTELPKGPVVRRVLRDVIPFSNELQVLTLSEKQLFEVLEHGVATLAVKGTTPAGQFLHVSGIAYRVDCSRPPEQKSPPQAGSRVTHIYYPSPSDGSFGAGEKAVARSDAGEAGSIRTVVSSYIGQGGDGYKMLGERPDRDKTGRLSYAVVEDYLARIGPQSAHLRLPREADQEKARIRLVNCE